MAYYRQALTGSRGSARLGLGVLATIALLLLAACSSGTRVEPATPTIVSASPTLAAVELIPSDTPTDAPISDTGTPGAFSVATATPDLTTPTPASTLEPTLVPTSTVLPTSVATPKATTSGTTAGSAIAPPRRPDAPIELKIPRIGVDATIETVGVDRYGAMATPTSAFRVGWFGFGTLPGEAGNAVVDGHLDSAVYGAAVFWRLGDLRPGDLIQVRMPNNRTLTFVVEKTVVYSYNNAPLADIFGPASGSRLNLITCTGIFDHNSKNYDRRLVVYARLSPG